MCRTDDAAVSVDCIGKRAYRKPSQSDYFGTDTAWKDHQHVTGFKSIIFYTAKNGEIRFPGQLFPVFISVI
jgi:hypothetical protein